MVPVQTNASNFSTGHYHPNRREEERWRRGGRDMVEETVTGTRRKGRHQQECSDGGHNCHAMRKRRWRWKRRRGGEREVRIEDNEIGKI